MQPDDKIIALLRHTMDSDADRFYLRTIAEGRDLAVGEVESIWNEIPQAATGWRRI